jgi:hypothetical protein
VWRYRVIAAVGLAVSFVPKVYAAVKPFFDNAPEFNQATDFMFNSGT